MLFLGTSYVGLLVCPSVKWFNLLQGRVQQLTSQMAGLLGRPNVRQVSCRTTFILSSRTKWQAIQYVVYRLLAIAAILFYS